MIKKSLIKAALFVLIFFAIQGEAKGQWVRTNGPNHGGGVSFASIEDTLILYLRTANHFSAPQMRV